MWIKPKSVLLRKPHHILPECYCPRGELQRFQLHKETTRMQTTGRGKWVLTFQWNCGGSCWIWTTLCPDRQTPWSKWLTSQKHGLPAQVTAGRVVYRRATLHAIDRIRSPLGYSLLVSFSDPAMAEGCRGVRYIPLPPHQPSPNTESLYTPRSKITYALKLWQSVLKRGNLNTVWLDPNRNPPLWLVNVTTKTTHSPAVSQYSILRVKSAVYPKSCLSVHRYINPHFLINQR